MDKLDSGSLDITKMNIEKLKEMFPNAVTEGKVDFDVLKNILGEEIDDSKEKYQFTWKGKAAAIKLAQAPSTATLRPCKEESKDWDTTENLYIEGDNLEVLKQLQKTYFKKIDLIYIDPPYNTGNDFVYKDNFKKSIENYREQTNQWKSSNSETNGRFHTDWLNMMYPRIMVAKTLLKETGLIFISISDHEADNLKKICFEIFGEKSFIGNVVWKKTTGDNKKNFVYVHDNILIFSGGSNALPRIELNDKQIEQYKNNDNDPNGRWAESDYRCKWTKEERPNLYYGIRNPNTNEVIFPDTYAKTERVWAYEENSHLENESNGLVYWGLEGKNKEPKKKRYLSDHVGVNTRSIWDNLPFDDVATQEIKELFGATVFDTPKPVGLIEKILKYTNENAIVLDFFAGSSTTAHAIMKTNLEENYRKFILVQTPEKCKNNSLGKTNGFDNISDIGKERIRRAGEKVKEEWLKSNQNEGLFATDQKDFPVDIGFKVFKLDSTNIIPWDNDLKLDEKMLSERLKEVFKVDRSKEDILYEILLKYGVFDMEVKEIKINDKVMFQLGTRYMIVCLDNEITIEDINGIIEQGPKIVIFKEAGFRDDNDKVNAVYNLEKAGIEDVKCI